MVSVGDLDIGATGSYYSFSFMIFSWVLWLMCILEHSICMRRRLAERHVSIEIIAEGIRLNRTSLPRLLGGSDHELPCNFHHDHLQLGLCRITWCVFLHICAPCLANGYIGFISLQSHQGQEPLIFEGPVWKQEEPGGKSEGNQRSKAPSKAVVEFQSRCLTYESFFN